MPSFQTNEWSCNLLCSRCTHTKPDGTRCKNRVCIGAPVCWVHTRTKYGVCVKTSTIPGAGKGLFASRQFERNEWICPAGGELIDHACLDERYPGDMTAPYAIDCNTGYLDSACKRGIGMMANAKINATTGKCTALSNHNARSFRRHDGVWLRATKRIRNGDEIFHHYGGAYRMDFEHTTSPRRRQDSRPC